MEGVTHDLGPGPFWEHIDFNHDDPLLSQKWVREAISLAIDREALLEGTVGTIDPEASSLASAVWMAHSLNHHPNFVARFAPELAEQIACGPACHAGT